MRESKQNKTSNIRKEDVQLNWIILDAEGKTLGRFCSEVAKVLRGKHKPSFTPNVDVGDGVIVINAEKVRVSGAKEAQKLYRYHTGHIGGLREVPYRNMMAKNPEFVIRRAVQGMMPKSRLGKQQLRKLRVFKGEQHDHEAQQPLKVEV